MALPITIPNVFANATTSIPLANLDANFVTVSNAINGIGNGAEALANVNITGGSIANVTGVANAQVNIIAGTGLSGGGNLVANVNLAIANTTVVSGTYGNANTVSVFTVNNQGQLTSASNTAIAIGTAQVTGLGTIATQDASNVAITGGSFSNVVANNTNRELVTINANGAANTINYDVKTQQVLLYTGNATANVTINIRGDGSSTLNDTMANNQSLTVAFAMTNNATARYVSLTQIDGSNVTPKWQGGAPTSGTANSTEVYVYNVIKTGTSTYTVLASKTAFT